MPCKRFCKSCRIQTRQPCVKSSAFINLTADDLEEPFQQWNGVIYVCKRPEQGCAFLHFENEALASVCFHSRHDAMVSGERVAIMPVLENSKPVQYAQRPLFFPPSPAPSTSGAQPQQPPPQPQHDAFNRMIKRNIDVIDDMLQTYEEEVTELII
ncbi:hypothetical protein DFQ30_005270 [Apophysomyces sp. BC1015]|nr:hypothetical protein DFQ30_005270 [Apophysomyces sp. BC1015]KAG0183355.1 hypothetical protein DFQ29_005730 [Apophysomyces sp. BC1021]